LRLSPILAVAPLGGLLWIRRPRTRALAVVMAAVIGAYLWINAGFAYWWGGWNYGPRYLVPCLGLWSLGLLPLWQAGSRTVRAMLLFLTAIGVGCSLMAVATTPQPPDVYQHPFSELFWPLFRRGELAVNWESILDIEPGVLADHLALGHPRAAWNIGQRMGLQGLASLVPLAGVWLGAAALWIRVGRSRPS
jgi:hypothetical protein